VKIGPTVSLRTDCHDCDRLHYKDRPDGGCDPWCTKVDRKTTPSNTPSWCPYLESAVRVELGGKYPECAFEVVDKESPPDVDPLPTDHDSASYGKCPFCQSAVVTRERRPDGDDECAKGHVYPSRLSSQPDPVKGRDLVWESVVDSLLNLGLRKLIPYAKDRQTKGLATYGEPLRTMNGRNAARDALEEVLDAVAYVRQMRLERYGQYVANGYALVDQVWDELVSVANHLRFVYEASPNGYPPTTD
jgi:hypothetical protein